MEPDILGPPLGTVRALELDGNISLYDSASDQALVLNTTASDVWRLLDGEHDFAGVVADLGAKYAVSPDRIQRDVARAVAILRPFLAAHRA